MAGMWLTVACVLLWLWLCLLGLRSLRRASDRPTVGRRLRLLAAHRLERLAARLRHQPADDPFEVLWVQTRLGVVAQHVQRLEADLRMPARAERILSSQLAYDALLAQACALAGVDVPPHVDLDPAERFREEVELTSRGWSW
jgi:hypothetical protein